DIHEASPYFSLGTCLEGLDLVFNSIFNVQLEIDDTDQEDLWHSSVIKLAVKDLSRPAGSTPPLGYIYCDFFVRPNKPCHDCHFTIQRGCNLPIGNRPPQSHSSCCWSLTLIWDLSPLRRLPATDCGDLPQLSHCDAV